MAKFIKSFFHPTEKKRSSKGYDPNGEEDKGDFAPPLDGRRKLSISRSGRMKANKKRHSLTLDLYGENYQVTDKATSKEYHVHGKQFQTNDKQTDKSEKAKAQPLTTITTTNIKTPEEEIDSAFEIIDKS